MPRPLPDIQGEQPETVTLVLPVWLAQEILGAYYGRDQHPGPVAEFDNERPARPADPEPPAEPEVAVGEQVLDVDDMALLLKTLNQPGGMPSNFVPGGAAKRKIEKRGGAVDESKEGQLGAAPK